MCRRKQIGPIHDGAVSWLDGKNLSPIRARVSGHPRPDRYGSLDSKGRADILDRTEDVQVGDLAGRADVGSRPAGGVEQRRPAIIGNAQRKEAWSATLHDGRTIHLREQRAPRDAFSPAQTWLSLANKAPFMTGGGL